MSSKNLSTKDRVKNLRASLGLSQRDLAKEFRVTASAVAHWESGEREISGPVSKLLELYEGGFPQFTKALRSATGGSHVG